MLYSHTLMWKNFLKKSSILQFQKIGAIIPIKCLIERNIYNFSREHFCCCQLLEQKEHPRLSYLPTAKYQIQRISGFAFTHTTELINIF